jgi:NMD protein affecting ribosome stability and mRNA decay
MHAGLLAGHIGIKKTREKRLQDIHMALCDECESIKPPGRQWMVPLGKMVVGAYITYILRHLPRGNKYTLVVTDYLTKWVNIFPVTNQTAITEKK